MPVVQCLRDVRGICNNYQRHIWYSWRREFEEKWMEFYLITHSMKVFSGILRHSLRAPRSPRSRRSPREVLVQKSPWDAVNSRTIYASDFLFPMSRGDRIALNDPPSALKTPHSIVPKSHPNNRDCDSGKGLRDGETKNKWWKVCGGIRS